VRSCDWRKGLRLASLAPPLGPEEPENNHAKDHDALPYQQVGHVQVLGEVRTYVEQADHSNEVQHCYGGETTNQANELGSQ